MEIVSWYPQQKIIFFRKNEILYKARLLSNPSSQNSLVLYLFNTNQIITIKTDKQNKQASKNKQPAKFQNKITSPICGRIVTVHVKPEEVVQANKRLVTIESMKMENEILAPFDLFVKNVSITQGDLVKQDHVLLTIKKHLF
ncbi:acetyl-CoA carboxylase biotin carboxyl carrier protein subunit [Candidatus Babeliales bacterium]|nr:acetyl-CoA carboxylase biotin carboxyl carrier protein subunit [Candidatus Babeliales bacterium]